MPHALEAWLAFGYHLRWKFVDADTVSPRTLLDFRDHPCLELDRLDAGSTWADVEREVRPFEGNADSRPALRVPGRLRNQCGKGAIVIVANSERERDAWLISLRVRIAPWQTLARRATEIVRREGPHRNIVRDLGRTIYNQFASEKPLTAESIRDFGLKSHAKVAGDKAAGAVETVEAVTDVEKCVSVVCTLFQAVTITTTCIRMVSEGSRGRASLPGLHSELFALLHYTCQFPMLVVDPEGTMDDLRLSLVFRIQEDCVLTLGNIQEQLMQAWRTNVLAHTESEVTVLREKVVVALTREGSLLTPERSLVTSMKSKL